MIRDGSEKVREGKGILRNKSSLQAVEGQVPGHRESTSVLTVKA